MDTKNLVLLILGILMFAKAIWTLASPESARKFAAWWINAIRHVNTLTGALYIAAGVGLCVLVLFQQPLVNWLLGAMGILFIYAGILTIRFTDMERLIKSLVLNRKPFVIRSIGAVSMLVAAVVIWVALTS